MTSSDNKNQRVQRLSGGKTRRGPTGTSLQADPEFVRLLQVLDRFPEAKREVLEELSKDE